MAVRVGFVGVGGIARAHLAALSRMEDVELVAFCDVQQDRAQVAATEFGGAAYTDHRQMLEREKLDALYVCVPPDSHSDAEIIAARSGVHLFVEKPVAISMEKAREIESEITGAQIICSVGYHWRYQDSARLARERLAGRTVAMVMGCWVSGLPKAAWWRVMAQSGGQMMEQTTHILDLARYLVGDVKRVFATYALRTMTDVPNLDVPDVGAAVIHFANGAVGSISNACCLDFRYHVGLTVVCRNLVVEIGDGARIMEAGRTEEVPNHTDVRMTQNRIFIDAVKSGKRDAIVSDYCDAIKTLALTLAANESAATGRPVELAA